MQREGHQNSGQTGINAPRARNTADLLARYERGDIPEAAPRQPAKSSKVQAVSKVTTQTAPVRSSTQSGSTRAFGIAPAEEKKGGRYRKIEDD